MALQSDSELSLYQSVISPVRTLNGAGVKIPHYLWEYPKFPHVSEVKQSSSPFFPVRVLCSSSTLASRLPSKEDPLAGTAAQLLHAGLCVSSDVKMEAEMVLVHVVGIVMLAGVYPRHLLLCV